MAIQRVTQSQQNPVEDICSVNLTPYQGTFLFACFCYDCQVPIDLSYGQACHFASTMKHLQKLIIAVLGFFIRCKKVNVLFHGGTELHHILSKGTERRDTKMSLKVLC